MMTNPTDHAKAAMQMAFDAFGKPYIRATNVSIKWTRRKASVTWSGRSVWLADSIRPSFEQDDMSAFKHRPARHNIVHEAWHVVQAQGRSRIGWWWHYLWNRARLEREADRMAEKYRDMVK